MGNRRVFDYLHGELSLAAGEVISRMWLWEEVGPFAGSVPLTKETALRFLKERAAQVLQEVPMEKLARLTKKFERWDPDQDSPEEIFARICGGFKENAKDS